MKIIERPDSKTYVVERTFHFLKDEKETRNVLNGVDTDLIVKYGMSVDTATFQPLFFFLVKTNKDQPLNQALGYCALLELFNETVIGVNNETRKTND